MKWRAFGLILVLLAASCAPATPPAATQPASDSAAQSAPAAAPARTTPKRITVAILGELPSFWDDINPGGGTVPGIGQFEGLASSGLLVEDENGAVQAQLAEAVPTTDNGLWKVFPDGRMEVTFRIREGARWHDGQPFTSADLLFTADMGRDPDVRVFANQSYESIESVEASDPRTVVVKWKRPYIAADRMFGMGSSMYAQPMPKHILEPPFRQNKATLTDSPYWTTEFVGSGAFKLREWVTGSHVLLDANPDYVLGRPKVDQIEVKFIPDPSTLLANVFAGSVDLTFSRSVSAEQAATGREQWKEGKLVPYINGWTMMYPQLRMPTPTALADPQFRRALIMSIDRVQLAETLTAGQAPVADSIIAPNHPEFRAIESNVVKYSYDPNRAMQLLEGMGFTRSSEGFRDATGQRPSVEVRTTTNDANQKATLAVVDSFQRIGLAGVPEVIPVQRLQDRVYRTTFPGLELVNQPNGADGFENLLHSGAAPLPERDYRAPNSNKNRGSYVNPEYDTLMDRYRVTIPMGERMQVMGQLIRLQTDLQLVMGLFYSADAIVMSNRLIGVPPASTWNVQSWDVR
jgi:peptide/nickel transport system substrate-binding protein